MDISSELFLTDTVFLNNSRYYSPESRISGKIVQILAIALGLIDSFDDSMIPSLRFLAVSSSKDKLFISILYKYSEIVNNVSAELHAYLAWKEVKI